MDILHKLVIVHFLMVPALVRDVGILGVHLLIADLTGVSHVEMLAMSTLYVVLDSMQLVARLATYQTNVSDTNVTSNKILQ